MSQRKIGTLPLCAMLTGSILGSGIIILPPLVIDVAGEWAIAGWTVTALFGMAFAYVFAHVGTLFPGDGGAATAIGRAFGPEAKRLASYALMSATLFGPAAVMLTVVDYLPLALAPGTPFARFMIAGALQIVCAGLVLSGLKNMSRVGVLLAVSATALLLTGSFLTLCSGAHIPPSLPDFDGPAMGYSLLLMFFGIVGWEIVGNYGNEVHDPQRTIPRAAVLASVIIGIVFLGVGAGMQFSNFPQKAGHGVTALLHPLFGALAPWIMGGLVSALCVTTYIVFAGGVARLVAHLGEHGGMPVFLAKRNRFGAPTNAMVTYTLVHVTLIGLASYGLMDLADILAVSDGFFLTNALLGTLAAVRFFRKPLPRLTAMTLSLGILAVLTQSHWAVLIAICVMTGFVVGPRFIKPRSRHVVEETR